MKPLTAKRLLFILLAALTVIRLWYIAQLELSPDETYYLLWAKHLDWSYYSKGPGVAFVIKIGTLLFGDTAFGVRFFSPLFSLGTSLMMFFFARRLYNESVGLWLVLMMNATPLFNVGSLLMTIDPISIFFWMAALYTFWLALEKSPRFTSWWLATGLLIGLGFLAKYTNAMQLISIALVLATVKKYRREFLRPGFWSLIVLFLVCTIPVLVWNSNHAWITIEHLRERGNLDSKFAIHPTEFLAWLGIHFGTYSPIIFAGTLVALWQGSRLAKTHFKPRFLILHAAPILIMYALLSFKKAGEPNWTAPAFISLGIFTAAFWYEKSLTTKWLGKLAISGIALGYAMSLLGVSESANDWFAAHNARGYDKALTTRLLGWRDMAERVQQIRDDFEKKNNAPAFLIGNSYQTCSELAFYLPKRRVEGPGHPPVYIPESQAIENEFSFWPRYDEFVVSEKSKAAAAADYDSENPASNPFQGRNALYITDDVRHDPKKKRVPSALQRGFARTELIATFIVTRHNLPIRTVCVFACYHYKTIDL